MELWGGDSDLSGGSTQSSPLSAASLQTSFVAPNSYGLSIQPNTNSQIASIQFDAATGWLAIAGNSVNNIVKQTITGNGYYQFDIDGQLFSSDRSSASFWQSLDGATNANVFGINFDGGLGDDTLIVGSQEHIHSFGIIVDDAIAIQGEVHSKSLFFTAKDIINQGSIIASDVTAEFSHSYTDDVGAKIIAIDGGNILLSGGKTGDLQATGQFLATGLTGGKIDFRGKTVSLRGANLDASGQKGGGTILIGGDYQGGDSTGLGTLSNAQSTFVDKHSSVNANALTSGNGGKVIIWSDLDTDFRGNVNARGGTKSGDGGFVEVSGKQNLNFVGKVDVEAKNGANGRILLDPDDIIINPDDDDDSTFDVSNLQDIIGDVTLSATNSITLNTDVYFKPSRGTVALQAGGRVSLFGYLWAGLHDINITAGSIVANARGAIFSNPYSGNGRSGNIKLVSQREIDFGQTTIFTESNSSSGNITLEAGTYITTGLLTAYGKNRGGNIKLTANGDIFTSSIRTFSAVANGGGKGGNISIVSTNGSINTTNNDSYGSNGTSLYTVGLNGNSGSVILEAYGDIITNEINTASYIDGNGGNVTLKSKAGKVDTNGKNIYTSSPKGIAGNVTISVGKDINIGDISAGVNDSGDAIGQGGKVSLKGFGNITAGNITTASQSAGNAGKVMLEADGNIEAGNITTTSITGNAGNVTVKANLGTFVTGSLGIKVGNIDAFANGDGNAGDVKLTAGFDSDINLRAIRTNVGGNGKGDGGEAYITSGGNIVVDSVRADSIGGKAGNVRLIASKTVRVTSAFSVNGESYSIYTDSVDDASGEKGGTVTIQHSTKIKNTPSPFTIGDSNINGTFSSISDGVIGLITKQGGVHEIGNNFDLNEIHIKGNNFLASQSALLSALGFSTSFLSYAFKDNKSKLDSARNLYLLGNVGGFTLQQLKNIATDDTTYGVTIPSLDVNNAQRLLKAGLNFYLYLYGITTPRTQGHFIAQSLHETGGLKSFGEINPGVSGFDVGRGILQLTGKENYRDFGTYIGIAGLEKIPQVVSSDTGLTILSAMWYWSVQYATSSQGSLNSIAEMNAPTVATVDLITSKINYGEINIDPSLSPEYKITLQQNTQKRKEYFLNAKRVLGIT